MRYTCVDSDRSCTAGFEGRTQPVLTPGISQVHTPQHPHPSNIISIPHVTVHAHARPGHPCSLNGTPPTPTAVAAATPTFALYNDSAYARGEGETEIRFDPLNTGPIQITQIIPTLLTKPMSGTGKFLSFGN